MSTHPELAENTEASDVIDQPRLSKESWLNGATDLEEAEVYVEAVQDHVKIRALSAGQLARIQSQCLSMKGDAAKVDTQRLGVLKFTAGVTEPKFSEQEANVISHKFGRSFELVLKAIDELSGASEEDVNRAMRRFRPGR
jgi:hypothetical protein